jgi:hypothetical protein
MNARSVSNSGVLHALTRIRLKAGAFTMATALALTFAVSSTSVYAQQTTGALYGKVAGGSTVTAESTDTGAKRSVTAGSDGSYRIGALPPGNYKVTFSDGTSKEVSVALGSSTLVGTGSEVLELEKFVVGGLSVNPIDFGNTESVTVFNEKSLDMLPVARNPTAVALLAPGTTLGDTAFGNLASFGGASVSENAYFVNGFNISNFRNGLDPADVPFDFYNQFEIKTGGYGAEFGRSTGGVINATTKSGSNEYHAGANFYFQPDAGRENAPDSYFVNTAGETVPLTYNSADYWQEWQANVWASGALWKNKVFFYGLYNARNLERDDAITNGTRMLHREIDDPFYAVKIDIKPFDNHSLEYTGFQDESRQVDTERDFDHTTGVVSGDSALNYYDRGGRTHIGKYTGVFFEKLTVSAMFGKSTQNRTDSGSEDAKPFIYDGRSGSLVYIQGNPNLLISTASDEREATRVDVEYPFELFGNHRLRAGFDREDNTSNSQDSYSGGKYWRYYAIPTSGVNAGKINGVTVTGPNVGALRERIYSNGGSFQVKSDALYVEDNWSLFNDRLTLRLGLRSESFENLNGEGDTFIKVEDQKAPRLAVSYDLRGDKKTKVFANFGRYHLPIASNTNVRLAGGELFTEEYFVLTSVNADGTPVKGAKLGVTNVFSDGTVKDRRAIVDLDIKPMYQDEYIVGVQHAVNKDFSVKAQFTHRIISGTAIDDMIVDHALTAWANGHGFGGFDATGEHAYVLANPGRPIHMFWDFDGDGTLSANEEATLSPELLGYPKASRVYYALELAAEKVWDGKWNASLSYTWSQSFGNYEGWVLSDTGQDDAGITTLFDSPMNTVNTNGYLPNDRRHQVKAFGNYAINSEWQIGSTVLLQSGRPINKIGWQNDPVRGATSNDYLLVPRGSVGTTDWVFSTNLQLNYQPKWADKRLTLTLDAFNIFNGKAVTEVAEIAQNASGGTDPSYGTASSWQRPRYFRLSASFEY